MKNGITNMGLFRIALVLGIVYLASNNTDAWGWGWLVFILLISLDYD